MSNLTIHGVQTAADWASENPVLPQFALGIERDPATGAYTKAKLGDGVTAWNDLPYFDPAGLDSQKVDGTAGVKVYRAICQNANDPPDVVTQENSVGAIVWAKDAAGRLIGTLAGAFPSAVKTWCSISPTVVAGGGGPVEVTLKRNDANTIYLNADIAGNASDLPLNGDTFIEILVYP